MVITKNVHPAIVSEEEYEIAKATIAFMKKPDYRGTRKFALKGKVRCGNCRRSMVLMESGANDRVYCPHKKMTGKFAKCSDEMVSVSIIEGHVWYALKRVLYVLDAIQLDFEEKTTNLDSVRRKKIKQLEAESNVLKSERIYLLDCLVEQKKIKNLKEYLESVEFEDMGADSIDFLIIVGNAAIQLKDNDSIELIKRYIEETNIEVPYYKFYLKELELELEKKSGKIMRLLNKLSPLKKYLILQPQLNGIGINVEKILEDLKK